MSENSIGEYKKDIQVGITTLVASLGFFKVQELSDFIASIKTFAISNEGFIESTTIHTIEGTRSIIDFTALIFPFWGVIIYFTYLFAIAMSLYYIYKNKPKNHQKSIFLAVTCYFSLQILIIMMLLGTE